MKVDLIRDKSAEEIEAVRFSGKSQGKYFLHIRDFYHII